MNIRFTTVGNATATGFQKHRPRIRLSGLWLNHYGFEVDSVITAHLKQGEIVFRVEGKGIDTYNHIVSVAMQDSNVKVLYVKRQHMNKKDIPRLEVKGKWLEKLGFTIGETILMITNREVTTVKAVTLNRPI